MAWYWWLLIIVAGLFILRLIFGGERQRSPEDLEDFRRQALGSRYHSPEQLVQLNRQILQAADLVRALPILPDMGSGSTQNYDEITSSVRHLLETPNVRTKVVDAPHKITLVQDMPRGKALVREYARTGTGTWLVSTRQANGFDAAVAEVEADDVVDVVRCGRCGKNTIIKIANAHDPWTCHHCGESL